MTLSKSHQTERQHLKCVVCEKMFGSYYNPSIRAYSIFHPQKEYPDTLCEDLFYQAMVRLYRFLLESEHTVPVSEADAKLKEWGEIQLRKDMLCWCLARGYFSVDGLLRLEIPEVVSDELEESLSVINMRREDDVRWAACLTERALQALAGSLHPVPLDRMPFKQGELNLGESTLYVNIDTSNIQLKGPKRVHSEGLSSRISSLRPGGDRRKR